MDPEKADSRASTDVEAQEVKAVKEAPVAEPGQMAAEPTSAPATGPPQMPNFPEGGRDGWLAVVGGWCVMFVTFGYMNAFGVYEAYYLQHQLKSYTASDVAWIGSLQMFFQFSSSLFSGPLVDMFGPRYIIGPAAFMLTLAFMLTSLCKEYYQFILCQGVFGGLCSGMLYSPAAAVVGHYFHKKRPLVMGIITSGSACAGVICPIILDQLLNVRKIGFGWTQRTIGFIALLMAIVATLTIKPGVPPRKGTYLIPSAFKNMAYTLQIVGLFVACWGLFTPFFYLPDYAISHGMSVTMSYYLISIINAGSFFGRLVAGAGGIFVGQFNVLAVCVSVCAIMIWAWLRTTSEAGIIAFSLFYGAVSGGAISTMIATLAVCAPSPQQMGTYIGMASAFFGIAALTGTPINGALLTHYRSFDEPIYFSGACCVVGALILIGARVAYAPLTQWRA